MKTFYTAAILLTVVAMLIMQMSVRYNVILDRVSVGCTEFDTALKNINDAVKEADDKMYTAKKRARETADPLRKN